MTTDPTMSYIAERQSKLTAVLVTPFEMLRAMEGNPIVVLDSNGNEVLLRLPTEEEAVEMYRVASEKCGMAPTPEGEDFARRNAKPVKLA